MKKFVIIGNPLSHSLSPLMQNYWFKQNNIAGEYGKLELEEQELKNITNKIKTGELTGINITIPFKQKIIPFVEHLTEAAQKTNSVNTLYFEKGKVCGDNTDIYGFQSGFLNKITKKIDNNKKILVLGAGGVTPSIIYALSQKKIVNIVLANRTIAKAEAIQKQFSNVQVIPWNSLKEHLRDTAMIVNTTSLGMKTDDPTPFNDAPINKGTIFYDVIYNPDKTTLAKSIQNSGGEVFNGLEMLIYQGERAFEIWTGVKPKITNELISLMKAEIQ